MKIRNTFIIFIVSGFWHGANWTFIIWGALNAIYFLPLMLTNNNRNNLGEVAQGRHLPSIREFFQIMLTFGLTCFAWVFFRAKNLEHAISYLGEIFSPSLFKVPSIISVKMVLIFLFLFAFILFEWFHRDRQHALQLDSGKLPLFFRYSIYLGLVFCIIWIGGNNQDFIYFQF